MKQFQGADADGGLLFDDGSDRAHDFGHLHGQLEATGVGKRGDNGTQGHFGFRGDIEGQDGTGDGGDHVGGGQVLERFLQVQIGLRDVQFPQLHVYFVGGCQQSLEREAKSDDDGRGHSYDSYGNEEETREVHWDFSYG